MKDRIVTSRPTVSVITPVHNGAKYLATCISSILAQNYDNFEYIIVENESTDESLSIARHFADRDSRVRIVRTGKLLPMIENWNFALSQRNQAARYIKVVHADDWLFPDCLAEMVALAESDPDIGLVGAYRLSGETVSLDFLPYSDEKPGLRWAVVDGPTICRQALGIGSSVTFGSPTALLMRASVVSEGEPFYDPSLLHADLDACLRILARGWKFGFSRNVLTYTRRHEQSVTSRVELLGTMKLERQVMLRRYGSELFRAQQFGVLRTQWRQQHNRYLAKAIFELRPMAFWRYQREGMRALDMQLDWLSILGHFIAEACDIRRALRTLRSAWRNRSEQRQARTLQPAAFLGWATLPNESESDEARRV